MNWGAPIPPPPPSCTTGVYVVALTHGLEEIGSPYPNCPISAKALTGVLEVRPELRVDERRPTVASLARRLSKFWLAQEPILYIGLAGPRASRPSAGELAKRLAEYYETPLGARSPHAGGWFLKTLLPLNDLVVHFAYCDEANRREGQMLDAFAAGLSTRAREGLHDSERVMPFANLEHPPGVRKRHGITGAKEPRRQRSGTATSRPGSAPKSVPVVSEVASGRDLTQKITLGDLRAGVIRIPRAGKSAFPTGKAEVHASLRGDQLGGCLWDPRSGPDRERSGVLRVGRAVVQRLKEGERLEIRRDDQGIHLE